MDKNALSENSVREHLQTMKSSVNDLIDTLFKEISDGERIKGATYPQLTQALQLLVKTFAEEEPNPESQGELAEIFKYFEDVK